MEDSYQTRDGQTITVWQWPQVDGRPNLHWAHATGFHARMYAPLLDQLATFANISAWDMRGHGSSRDAGIVETYQGWRTYYGDLVDLLQGSNESTWLAGHSIGATTSMAAAALNPKTIRGLVLVEPVLMDLRGRALLHFVQTLRMSHRLSYVKAAAGRRNSFPSHQAAFESYRSKRAFERWPDEWLQAYVENGLVQSEQNGLSLACRPDWEVLTFAHTEASPWRNVSTLRELQNISVLTASNRSTMPVGARGTLQRLLPTATIQEIPNTSHFLPMEWTEGLVEHIRGCLCGDDSTVES